MENKAEHNQSIKKLSELIKDIDIAMLTTVESDGMLRSRPMSTQQIEFDGDLWFFTAANTQKIAEVQHEQNVNLSYAAPNHNTYVSVSGKASVVRDPKKVEELWSPILKAWFPKGLEDPDLVLLRVDVEQAEYWDSPSAKVVQLVGFVKALVTGKEMDGGENEKITLK